MSVVGAAVLGSVLVCVAAVGVWGRRRRRARAAGQVLLQATEVGDLDSMRRLLAQGAQVNARNDRGLTPLHIAAAGGDVAVVALLLQYGASVHARSNIGTTPLHQATQFGPKQAVVSLLLEHGAEPGDAWESGW